MSGIASWFEYVIERWDDVLDLTLQHAILVTSVMVLAIITAVGLGILVRDKPGPRSAALGITGVFLTIPSFALFTIFIPLVGLGFWPAFIALFMYALLPILRNTVAGLTGVDRAVLESARGMGLSRTQRLWKVQMPLAWPVILTGIRVSTLLTMGIAAIATLVAGPGLGEFIKDGLARFPLPTSVERIWTGTVFIILLALLYDAGFLLLRRVTTSSGISETKVSS